MTTNKIHAALLISAFWAIEPIFAESAMNVLADIDAEEFLAGSRQEKDYKPPVNGDSIIEISGTMMRGDASWGDSCNTVQTARLIKAAVRDPMCRRIVLAIDSPGGSVEGTAELAAVIASAAAAKPVIGYVQETCASAALWAISGCSEIWANPHANSIGSIGIYTVIHDQSKRFESQGVAPILISSGGVKGQPTAGLPISKEFLAYANERITGFYDEFVATLADGRGLDVDSVLSFADGRVFNAKQSLELGLIDHLGSWEEMLQSATRTVSEVKAEASEATDDMGKNILDMFKKPEAPAATTEPVETPQPEATEVHDMEAIAAAMQGAVASVVKAKVDKYVDGGFLTTAASGEAQELLLAAIEADGAEFEANGSLKEGRMFAAAKKLIEKLPQAKLSNPVLETTPVEGGGNARSVVVEADQFKSDADEYRKKAEASTPGMKKKVNK